MTTAEAAVPRTSARGAVAAAVRAEPLLLASSCSLRGFALRPSTSRVTGSTRRSRSGFCVSTFRTCSSRITETEATPPLYYATAWVWTHIFGTSEIGLRSFSAVLGTATVPVIFAAGKVFVSRRAGLVAAALATTSPLLIWYSQEARAHALLLLLGAASLYFFARALDDGNRRDLSPRGRSSRLSASLTFYLAALLFVAQAVVLAWEPGRRRAVAWAGAGVALVVVAIVPYALSQDPGDRTGYQALSLVERGMDVPNEFIFGRAWLGVCASSGRHSSFWCSLRRGLSPSFKGGSDGERCSRSGCHLAYSCRRSCSISGLELRFLPLPAGHPAWLPAAIGVGAILGAPRLGRLGVARPWPPAQLAWPRRRRSCSTTRCSAKTGEMSSLRSGRAIAGARLMFPWGPTSGAGALPPNCGASAGRSPLREASSFCRLPTLTTSIPTRAGSVCPPGSGTSSTPPGFNPSCSTGIARLRPRVVTPGQVVLVRRFLSFARLDRAPAQRRPPTRSP